MKNLKILIKINGILFFILFFMGCGKQKQRALAQNYYKMAFVELQDQKNINQYSYKKALEYINLALGIQNNPEYMALKATILLRLGYEDLAKNLFEDALLNTNNEKLRCEILNNKACLFAQIGIANNDNNNINFAMTAWDNLIKNKDYLTPEVALFNQSKIFVSRGDFIAAKYKLQETLYHAPAYLDAHYYLALVNYNLSDFNAAKREIDSVLFLYPEHRDAFQLKSLINNIL